MKYIQIKEETEPVKVNIMTCTHPLVTKIWEYGGGEMNKSSEWSRYICLELKDGTVNKFRDNGYGEAIEEADLFLQSKSMEV